jgi:hypothetical protein
MAFDWREYLKLAQFLQGCKKEAFTEEAAFRSAVSRAYYAAYGHAFEYAREHFNFLPVFKVEDQGKLRQCFKEQQMADVALKLDKLRQWRVDCDYRPDPPSALALVVMSAISRAEDVLKKLT